MVRRPRRWQRQPPNPVADPEAGVTAGRRFIRTAAFFRALPAPVQQALPPRLREVKRRVRSSQAQWYVTDPRIHFEAWWHANTGRLELGLHLESSPPVNERIARALSQRLLMIKARLGGNLDLEPWDRGWIRIYETYPMEVFDAAAVTRTAARIAELITVLWPLCEEALRPRVRAKRRC